MRLLYFFLVKNKMLIFHRKWLTLFQILAPCLLVTLLFLVNKFAGSKMEVPAINVTEISIYSNFSGTMDLYYSPPTTFTNIIMQNLQRTLYAGNTSEIKVSLKAIKNRDTFESLSYGQHQEDYSRFGIFFNENTGDVLPETLNYTIEMYFYEFSSIEPKQSASEADAKRYNEYGGMFFQYYIDKIYTGMATDNLDRSKVSASEKLNAWYEHDKYMVENFPYPGRKQSAMYEDRMNLISWLFITLGFILICPSILIDVIKDNFSGITELMRLMGLSRIAIWAGWLLKVMMVNLIPVIIVTIMLTVSPGEGKDAIITYGNVFLIWCFLLLWIFANVFLLFLVSTIFHKPIFALFIGLLVWEIEPSLFGYSYAESTLGLDVLLCLFPPAAAKLGWLIIIEKEKRNTGLQFNNLFESEFTSRIKMIHIFVMLLVSMFLLGLLTLYVEAIYPGKFGVRQPWHFPVTSIYKRLRGQSEDDEDDEDEDDDDVVQEVNYEAPAPNLKVQVRIQNLRKKFRLGNVTAINSVTIDFYRDQITVLLGHNGAGKTTLMSILTGMISYTSGVIRIDGLDLKKNMSKLRKSLGLCPQHDIFFEYLTVYQHLVLFGLLKGASHRDSKIETEQYIKDFDLTKYKNTYASQLSGGTRRKLSLGMAFMGSPKVVILDEPTSFMDPGARRQVWNLLLNWRGTKTVLITTHIMEEADVLADRIAIMDHGVIKCYGTSLYLKKKYGSGFRLTAMTTKPCDVKLTNLIKTIVGGSVFKGRFGAELSFTLPENQRSSFPQLFDAIDDNKKDFGIVSFGVSPTTLEEVFIKVGEDTSQTTSSSASNEPRPYQEEPLTGCSLILQQFHALFVKIILCSSRRLNFLLVGLVLIIIVIASILVLEKRDSQASAVQFSLKILSEPEVYYSVGGNESAQGLAKAFVSIVKAQGGKSTKIEKQPLSRQSIKDDVQNITNIDGNREIFVQYISHTATKEGSIYSNKIITGAIFNSDSTEIVYDLLNPYALPICLNLINNAQLRYMHTGKSIVTFVKPIYTDNVKYLSDSKKSIVFELIIPISFAMFTTCFLAFPLSERISDAKHLQLMTGLSPLIYWLTIFLWDFLIYMIIVCIVLGVVPLCDTLGYFSGSEELIAFAGVLILYGFSVLLQIYCLSLLFASDVTGISYFILIHFFITFIMMMLFTFASALPLFLTLAKTLYYVLLPCPQFLLYVCLRKFAAIVVYNYKCNALSSNEESNFYHCSRKAYAEVEQWFPEEENKDDPGNGFGFELIAMFIDGIVYILILMLVDYAIFSKLCFSLVCNKNQIDCEEDDDDDVKKEREVIDSGQGNYFLVVQNLGKLYCGTSFRRQKAVDGLSFGVPSGQCFGLLGTIGSGKTTAFKMLTGFVVPSSGSASVNGVNIHENRREYLSYIGYCPQENAFNDVLTSKEVLYLYARLRGIPKTQIDEEVDYLLAAVGITQYKDKRSGTYSGGNKRKLCIATALLGDPPLVFLDEPTSGVDPAARRHLWAALMAVQKSGNSIVLTSHSMDECEALCNRLTIMVAGKMKCLGEISRLKGKFGQGFTLMVKLKVEGVDDTLVDKVKARVVSKFSPCELKQEHTGYLHYHINNPRLKWTFLFDTLEEMKTRSLKEVIDDYTISETTLEEVFLSFTVQ